VQLAQKQPLKVSNRPRKTKAGQKRNGSFLSYYSLFADLNPVHRDPKVQIAHATKSYQQRRFG
jgi:hypothetical protein